MKNKIWILILVILIIVSTVAVYLLYTKNNDNKNTYTAQKSSTNEQNQNNESDVSTSENLISDNNVQKNNTVPKKEEQIATFSTKIYDLGYNRQNNVTITCSTLNDTIVTNGSTFSFCDTVGRATPERGYLESDIFDKDGNKIKGFGGGNCQVSSTLYNALLQIPQLTIIERHEHSNKVPYIETGKDAAVAYGSYDLKFKNDYGSDIKIKAENTTDAVTISLFKIF